MRPLPHLARLAALLAVAGLTITGCGSAPDREDRMSQSQSARATDQNTINEALAFGGIVPPASAKVLGVQYDRGIDERYRVVMSVEPGDVPVLLSASGFTAPLAPDAGPFQASVDGFDLDEAKSVRSTDDSLPPGDGRTQDVTRLVAVDESDSTRSVVHLWLFTT